MAIKAPVVLIIFNRPELLKKTFEMVRQYQPKELFIIADGPRKDHPGEAEKCKETRNIVSNIDWECKVHQNYSSDNMTCSKRIHTGLSWVFKKVDRAIILEDDCLPNSDFFDYCATLLELYKNEEKVWSITGDNFQSGRKRGSASYYFSKYFHGWGWATWARCWNTAIDENLSFWPSLKKSKEWTLMHPNKHERKYWGDIYDDIYNGKLDYWDYWFSASITKNYGLTATPNVNLVTNEGFGPDGTHTLFAKKKSGLKNYSIGNLTHPEAVKKDKNADSYLYNYHYGGKSQFIYRKLLRFFKLEEYAKKFFKLYFKS